MLPLLPANEWIAGFDELRAILLSEIEAGLSLTPVGLAGAEFELASHREHVAALAEDAIAESGVDFASRPPVVIGGLPRSGTTLLQILLDRSGVGHAPLSWEILMFGDLAEPGSLRARRAIEEADARAQLVQQLSPRLFGLHPFGALAPAECTPTLAASLLCQQTLFMFDCPSFAKRIEESDGHFTYALWRENIARLSRLHGERLILKSPMHVGHYARILQIVPEVQIIQVRRSAEDVLASILNLVEVGQAVFNPQYDPSAMGRHWLQWMRQMLATGEQEYRQHKASIMCIQYSDLLRDPDAVVSRIAEHVCATVPMEPGCKEVAHRLHKRHTTPLRPLRHFGLSRTDVREELRPYLDGPLVC